jgi:Mrp family chromosome partitioning ATPase
MNCQDIERCRNGMMVVYSPGGGNGKSEIAANLAFCLAEHGKKTWLLDANIFAPAQDLIFGLQTSESTFSEYLYDPSVDDIPAYEVSRVLPSGKKAQIYLTPMRRNDQCGRFLLHEQLNGGNDIYDEIPEDVFRKMDNDSLETLIVDTYPSFEPINEVWLGMTDFLLIVSRMNDIDIENLKMLLQDGNVADIRNTVIVFNNVQLDDKRNVFKPMANDKFKEKLHQIREEIAELAGNRDDDAIQPGDVHIFDSPFLYSPELAKYGETVKRYGLFVQVKPDDAFSVNIRGLAEYIWENKFIG